MKAKSLIPLMAAISVIGLLVATPLTLLDWYKNPAGIFHGPEGTHWKIVLETFISWLWPVLFVACGLAIPEFARRMFSRKTENSES